ncbi:toll/interleukin-1 receptor domain-containing protein [Candidatus Amarolinea dominans]|uniref:toll/interleukin-1 receptor domain-containing protein n=1 Tax=Candidatus Amarolinea dominans TaxID=3140696 RepID=UPI0031CC3ADE
MLVANWEQLRVLREGVERWNRWREEHPNVRPELSDSELGGGLLVGANLREANLVGVHLSGRRISQADLVRADLRGSYLDVADLDGADLSGANLGGANLDWAYLGRADFSGAIISGTAFGDVDLSEVKGLESVVHQGPSTIGIDTVYRSRGRIPEVFLRGCGVPDKFIDFLKSQGGQANQYHSCFISYSSKDQAFAERLHADLQAKGVRCWFAPKDMKIGDPFRQRIDEAIRVHDKLLLILSEHSVKSDWVASEVEAAFEKERRHAGQSILFPIRLDDAIMDADQAWAADIRRTRHIGDFTRWKEHDTYAATFDRLMRDLKAAQG